MVSALNLTDYPSVPPDKTELDDNHNSLESMMDHSGIVEGTCMNPNLYDTYANPNSCPLLPWGFRHGSHGCKYNEAQVQTCQNVVAMSATAVAVVRDRSTHPNAVTK